MSRAPRSLLLYAVVLAAVAACAPRPAAPPKEMDRDLSIDGWICVESQHASILSAAGERRTLELAAQLERLIGVLRATGPIDVSDARVPATLFLFASSDAYDYYRPGNAMAHFFESSRGYFILVSPEYESRSVLFHEYVHLMARSTGVEYPTWYNEGLAQLLETMTFREHLVSVGSPPGIRMPVLRGSKPLPLDVMLGARSYADVSGSMSQFYADAWLLTHLLHFGHHAGYPRRVEALRAYLAALDRSSDWRSAFDASFPGGLDALQADFASYRERVVDDAFIPRLRIDSRKLQGVDTRATSRAVAPATIAVELGWIYLDLGAPAARYAQRMFERALELEPTSARARAGLARALALQGDFDGAFTQLGRAGSTSSNDAVVLRARGAVLLLQSGSPAGDPSAAEALRRDARESLRQAIALEPGVPEGHVLLGVSYLESDGDSTPGLDAFRSAAELLPQNEEIHLGLARLYARTGETSLALAHVDRVLRWSHGESLERARALRDEIERDAAASTAKSRAGGS